jgi:hypothetical protein
VLQISQPYPIAHRPLFAGRYLWVTSHWSMGRMSTVPLGSFEGSFQTSSEPN